MSFARNPFTSARKGERLNSCVLTPVGWRPRYGSLVLTLPYAAILCPRNVTPHPQRLSACPLTHRQASSWHLSCLVTVQVSGPWSRSVVCQPTATHAGIQSERGSVSQSVLHGECSSLRHPTTHVCGTGSPELDGHGCTAQGDAVTARGVTVSSPRVPRVGHRFRSSAQSFRPTFTAPTSPSLEALYSHQMPPWGAHRYLDPSVPRLPVSCKHA